MLYISFFFQDNLLNRIEGQEQELAATQEEEVGKLEVWVGVGVPVVKGGGVGVGVPVVKGGGVGVGVPVVKGGGVGA